MMFPKKEGKRQWTLSEIDQLDVHFFNELMNDFEELEKHEENQVPKEREIYLSEIW